METARKPTRGHQCDPEKTNAAEQCSPSAKRAYDLEDCLRQKRRPNYALNSMKNVSHDSEFFLFLFPCTLHFSLHLHLCMISFHNRYTK